jgi:DNA polymerase
MTRISLPRLGTFAAWRDAARLQAAAGTPPDQLSWQMEGAGWSLFDDALSETPKAERQIKVPGSFIPLAKQLCAHRSLAAFDLAYRLLCRLVETPGLLNNRADTDVAHAEKLAKNIRRDMHKMKAFVRFREVTADDARRRQFISWFEPDHRIEDLIGGFFTRRFGDMDWVIVTPEITMKFENGDLSLQAIESARPDLTDETEELWRTYYANIFNPARLKIKAMQSEMPKKYWKNLPEADLIPDLIAQAEAQVTEMRASGPTLPPVRAERVLERLQTPVAAAGEGLSGVHKQIRSCHACPLAGPATQAVPGEGPANASLMIVGEQPGDHEDLAGRPFVGPAGQLFDEVASEIGLDRHGVYITNAVKHFKFRIRGKRRIHQSPDRSEIHHCRWWLQQEIALIRPILILGMGATAAQALTGDGKSIMRRRGHVEKGLDGLPVLLTLHPAALLRQANRAEKDKLVNVFKADLLQAKNRAFHTAQNTGHDAHTAIVLKS